MTDFVPPYPPRLKQSPPVWKRLALARRNFLAMWEEDAFDVDFFGVRVLRNRVFLCNSPDSVRFVLSTANDSFQRKAAQMRRALEPVVGDSLFISDGATWRSRRKVVAPILHPSRLSGYAPVMVETALEARDRWAASAGPPVDIRSEMAHVTAQVICRTVFGRHLGRDRIGEVVRGFTDYQEIIDQLDVLSLLGLPEWVPRWHGRKERRAAKRIHAVLDDIIADHLAGRGADAEASALGRLLSARDPESGEPLGRDAVRNEAATLFLAGNETTANALTWAWYLLSQAPDAEARLHDELDAVLGGRPPTLDDVPRLVYTKAVFQEAMRLYPPVPILPREALREETFQGQVIPKGSMILVVPWLLHRHRRLWDRPDHFRPERFLEGSGEPISKFAYIPFGIGPRFCAGMYFGMTEGVLVLATLARDFELRLQEGFDVRPFSRLSLRPEGGMPMSIRARAGAR